MKKLLTSLLCVMMVVCFMPAMAWAEENAATATLPEAVDGIITISEDGSYEISENLTASIVIEAGADVTLNIEENVTLTNSESNHTITNNGTLTITGKGTVENKNTGAKGALYNAPGATANLNGCTFTGDKWYVIKNLGTMTIDGAAVIQNDAGSSGIDNGYYGNPANDCGVASPTVATSVELTIKSGNLSGGMNTVKNDDFGVLVVDGGTFENTSGPTILNWNEATINSGNFAVNNTAKAVIAVGHLSDNLEADKGVLTINGGTFTSANEGQKNLFGYGKDSTTGATVTITGGTFNGAIATDEEYPYTPVVTGGIYSSDVTDYVAQGDTVATLKTSDEDAVITYYYIGKTASQISDAAKSGDQVEVIQGDLTLTNVADGVTVKNSENGGNVEVNGTTVAKGDPNGVTTYTPVYIPTIPTTQKPVIEPNADVTTTLSTDGTTLTIKANDGYEITDVTVNGVSKGAVTTLTGLKTGDKVVVTAKKIETPDDNAALIEAVKNVKLVARSAMSKAQGKKAVKITWYATDGSDVELDGVEIFRSTKRYSGYGTTPIFTTAKAQYHNTAIKKGTKYYYKVRGYKIIDGEKVYTDWSTKAWRTVK